MPTILELIGLGVAVAAAAGVFLGVGPFARRGAPTLGGPKAGAAPARQAAEALRDLSSAHAELKSRYPSVVGMLSGYLNAASIEAAGGLEGAVREMLADWAGRREQVKTELVRLLAENENEEDVRAIVLAACDASFDQEGYRNWLIWLLGRFAAM